MPTFKLVPDIADGAEFISEVLKVPQNTTIAVQTYTKALFTVEASIDDATFYPITNIVEPGLYRFDPGALVIRLRADAKGTAPYALFLFP